MDGGTAGDGRGEDESPVPTPTPSSSPKPDEPSAAEKYANPVDPVSTPAWVYPVVAVGVVVLLGAAPVTVRLLLRKRQQGW